MTELASAAPAPAQGQLSLPLVLPPAADEALRHIVLGQQVVSFRLLRSRRRTLSMTVDRRGLRVGAPLRVPLREIEDFLRSNGQWVLRKIEDWQAAIRQHRFVVADGARLPVLGAQWSLRLEEGRAAASWDEAACRIDLRCPARIEPRLVLGGALRRRALALFEQRAAVLARPLQRPLPRIGLSNAQTRWGSCSSKTGLRFNWRLIHLPLALVDYVVAHELAHLLEMNHSWRFWNVVAALYPDYAAARRALRDEALTLPLI